MKIRKPGRPKLPKAKAKGVLLSIRTTPDERRAFEAAALAEGLSLSDWSRKKLTEASGRAK
jgi:uncharacterized protein (DUF1778 family)